MQRCASKATNSWVELLVAYSSTPLLAILMQFFMLWASHCVSTAMLHTLHLQLVQVAWESSAVLRKYIRENVLLRCAFSTPFFRPSGIPLNPRIFKNANSHRDGAIWGRHPRNCLRFWCLKAFILVTAVAFGPSCFRRAEKVPTVLIAIFIIGVICCPSCFCHVSKVPTDTGTRDGGGPRRDLATVVGFKASRFNLDSQ